MWTEVGHKKCGQESAKTCNLNEGDDYSAFYLHQKHVARLIFCLFVCLFPPSRETPYAMNIFNDQFFSSGLPFPRLATSTSFR